LATYTIISAVVPDSILVVTRSDDDTSTEEISFSWEAPSDGGSPVIEYTLKWD